MEHKDEQKRRWPDYVIIGQVRRPHGLRGVLRVEPLTDNPQRFELLRQVYLSREEGNRTLFTIENVNVLHDAVLMTLQEITSRESADQWRQALLEIPGKDLQRLPEGKHYLFELLGLTIITDDGQTVGELYDIIRYPKNDVYVVRNGEREYLIPAAPEIILKVDDRAGIMTIKRVDGLLD